MRRSPLRAGSTALSRVITIVMTKRLVKVGNSLALIVDKAVLDLLHITPETEFDITTDGRRLLVSPLDKPQMRKELAEVWAGIRERHGELFEKLAE